MTTGTHCGFPLPISRSFWPTAGGYGNGLEAPVWAAVLDYLDCGPELVEQSRARVVRVVGETTQPPCLRHRRRGLQVEAARRRLSYRPTTISCGCHPGVVGRSFSHTGWSRLWMPLGELPSYALRQAA
jgi:hypothetical protein